jgi:predicted amidohydrolase YtcJ
MSNTDRLYRYISTLATVIAPLTSGLSAQAPTVVLLNGRVFTGDSARPWVEALAIRGDRISAIGTSAEMTRLAAASTQRFDLGGRVAIAGINDAHDHLPDIPKGVGFRTSDSPTPDPSLAQVLDSLRSLAARTPPGTWLSTQIGMAIIGNSAARRGALDRVTPNHPVALFSWWGHPAVLNSAALSALHIADDTKDALGGWYERDASGRLTGRADEYAKMIIDRTLRSTMPHDVLVQALRDYAMSAARQGVTSVQDMATSLDPGLTARVFRDAQLPIRTRIIRMPMPNARGRNEVEWDTVAATITPNTVVAGRKWILDGTPIEGNALRRTPYPGTSGSRGRSNFPTDTIRAILAEALRPNAPQLHLHIVGDSETVLVLNLMSSLAADSVWRHKRVRFEHGNGLIGEQLARARRMGIVIAQPRAETAPLRTWVEAGIPVAYGSDGLRNPYVHMMNAVAKPGGDSTQRISREDWVQIMTRGSAWAEGAERDKGMLVPGMLADVAVLSQNIFTVPAQVLPGTASVLTTVGGHVIAGSLPAALSSGRGHNAP